MEIYGFGGKVEQKTLDYHSFLICFIFLLLRENDEEPEITAATAIKVILIIILHA